MCLSNIFHLVQQDLEPADVALWTRECYADIFDVHFVAAVHLASGQTGLANVYQPATRKSPNAIVIERATLEYVQRHDGVCAICYNDLQRACLTPCKHLFHTVCLRKWLNIHRTCPLCQYTILF